MDEFRVKMQLDFQKFKEKVERRQEYNIKCLNLLRDMILSYPELRFGQILCNLKLNGDIFNEESVDTYERIKRKIK